MSNAPNANNAALHFHILEDIAQDLSADTNFPTCLDVSLTVRNVLKDPLVSIDKVTQVVNVEPLISAKLLQLANSVVYNVAGSNVTEIRQAIQRVGFETVRTTSLGVAMEQMLHSRNVSAFEDIARLTWEHSLQVAAIGRVLARRIGHDIHGEDAMLVGMVNNIGVFYLLYRAADYPAYHDNREAILELLTGWSDSIGENLLAVLGLPDSILSAIHAHNNNRYNSDPFTLADVLYYACLLAENNCPWLGYSSHTGSQQAELDRARYADLLAEAQDDIRELQFALGA
ncbi:MAG: HDOD domain-containing protein [Zoogloeaceae bacterium]|jgi:HD-like signal output (HDOD) protein|nr:HDOD domain-containing protein [Zoogloeaceae bacterium]